MPPHYAVVPAPAPAPAPAPDQKSNDARPPIAAPNPGAPPHPEAYVFDRDMLMPLHLIEAHGLPRNSALLEVPYSSVALYASILRYAAEFAVDLSQHITPQHDFPHLTPSPSPRAEKLFDSVPVPVRHGPGRLSSLWNSPEDAQPRIDFSAFDSESGSDSDSDTEPNIVHDHGSRFEFLHKLSVRALKKMQEPLVRRYQLGLGYAKLYVRQKLVIIRHLAYGMPVSDTCTTHMYRFVVLAAEDPTVLKELCAVAMKWRSANDLSNIHAKPGKFILFRFRTNGSGSGDWESQGFKKARPVNSVILQKGQMDSIIADIEDFLSRNTKTWYQHHGLPHRRSYLFYGPPGVGKTSTIRVIAGIFRLNACFLSLTAADFSNQVLHDALTSLPRCALLVLEDVDVLFGSDRKSEGTPTLTFSGMLNALDGLISVDGIITIFTTNFIEKLDPALIRAGRVDRRFEFVHPKIDQICSLFKSFYEDSSNETAKKFAKSVFDRPEEEARSIATLQQHFIFTRKKSAEECVKLIPQFFKEFYPNSSHGKTSIYT
ncbi:unnamed protein product [Agarophyton chilense]